MLSIPTHYSITPHTLARNSTLLPYPMMSRPASRTAARRGGRRTRTSITIPPALQPAGRIEDTSHAPTLLDAATTPHAALGIVNTSVDSAPPPSDGNTTRDPHRGTPLSEATTRTVNAVPATAPPPPRGIRPQREVRTVSCQLLALSSWRLTCP